MSRELGRTEDAPEQPHEEERHDDAGVLRAELARLRAELAAVRRDRNRFSEASAAVHELIAVVCEERVVYLNPAGQRLLGIHGDDALGLRLPELLAPGDYRRLREVIAPGLDRPGARWCGELHLRRADGTLVATAHEVRALFPPEGPRELILCAGLRHPEVDTDDEHTRLLARLRSLTAVLENTSDFVAMADTSGQILYVNPAGMALVGRAGEDPRTLRVADLQAPRDYERLITELFPFVQAHGSWLGELFLWHTDGSEIPVSQVVTVVRNPLADHVGYATISRDITLLKRSEAARQRAVEAAEAANRAKSVFLAHMSHELRTPLNAILGFAQLLLRDGDLGLEEREHLEVINRSGEHLLSLINDVLEMSKIEAGRITLSRDTFDLRLLFADLKDMLRLRVASKGLRLHAAVDPGIPAALIGDSAKIRQVVLNLLGNAIKFTPEGTITLHARIYRQGAGAHLWIAVEDTGTGIAADDLPRLFRPFEQTASGQRACEGTGLGLTISQHFVRMMGGELHGNSKPGVGSLFSFDVAIELPAGADPAALPSSLPAPPASLVTPFPPRRPPRRDRGPSLAPGEPRRRLLIAEDRPQNRDLLRSLLEPIGFEIREAADGAEALEIAREWTPDLVWMDIQMPVMDGYEATRRIKALPAGPAIQVIALSANVFADDRARMEAAGCVDFVAKPFRAQALYDLLERHLGCTFV